MEFQHYQEKAKETDQTQNKNDNDQIIIPLLGLISEAGSLLTEYKKNLRDGSAYQNFNQGLKEELGDLLWYISTVATKFDLDLEEIAKTNLDKCNKRWGWRNSVQQRPVYIFDKDYLPEQKLPRKFTFKIYEFKDQENNKDKAKIEVYNQNEGWSEQFGATLTDNAYEEDHYRFHDIFHLSYAVHLGWSPVIRSNLKRKRRHSEKDEVEDGGRAIVIEEGISALIFSYARKESCDYLDKVNAIDYWLLKTIKYMTSHLEVKQCSMGDWEQAIFEGYEVWRKVRYNKGGIIEANLDLRTMIYKPL